MRDVFDLILAEQFRARQLHPDDHAGHPSNDNRDHYMTLEEEVGEVAEEAAPWGTDLALAWELVQVAGVAAAWVKQLIDDGRCDPSDLFELIEHGATE